MLRRVRFGKAPLTPQCTSVSFLAAHVARRSFVNRLVKAASTQLERMSAGFVLANKEDLITEPRRKFEKVRVMEETLAERIQLQKGQRQDLVPSTIRVSKCRRYLVLEWQQRRAAATCDGATQSDASTSGILMPEAAVKTSPLPAASSLQPPRRPTRLLAELLRAKSSSTDVAGSGVLIYGKRGLTITEVVPHGNYAVRLQFSDDHSGGVFAYDYLHFLGESKWAVMRQYITDLKNKRRSRIPPKRAPSLHRPKPNAAAATSAASSSGAGCASRRK